MVIFDIISSIQPLTNSNIAKEDLSTEYTVSSAPAKIHSRILQITLYKGWADTINGCFSHETVTNGSFTNISLSYAAYKLKTPAFNIATILANSSSQPIYCVNSNDYASSFPWDFEGMFWLLVIIAVLGIFWCIVLLVCVWACGGPH